MLQIRCFFTHGVNGMLSISAGGSEHSTTANLTPVWGWESESCLHIQVFALSVLLGSELALDIVRAKSLQSCPTLCYPIDCSPPRLLCPWGFSRQKYWSGCHALLQGIFLTQRLNPCPLCLWHWQVGSLSLVSPGKSHISKLSDASCPPPPHSFPVIR